MEQHRWQRGERVDERLDEDVQQWADARDHEGGGDAEERGWWG